MTLKQKNIIYILFTSLLWGLNGNMGTYLFHNSSASPTGLTAVQLLFGGALLLGLTQAFGQDVFDILRAKSNLVWLTIYGIFELFVMQFTLYAYIFYSNPSTTCFLQYCRILLMIFYTAVFMRVPPRKVTWVALILTVIRVILLLTKGDFGQLQISDVTLLTRLISMLGYTVSNIAPLKLTLRYPTEIAAGWAMVTGGFFMVLVCILRQKPLPDLGGFTLLASLYCIIFGTMVPFNLYLANQKIVGPIIASLLDLGEYVFSTIFSIFWLEEVFSMTDLLGMVLIFTGVILMSLPDEFWKRPRLFTRYILGQKNPRKSKNWANFLLS